jgi:hypothetical protein
MIKSKPKGFSLFHPDFNRRHWNLTSSSSDKLEGRGLSPPIEESHLTPRVRIIYKKQIFSQAFLIVYFASGDVV